ncbi:MULTISPECIES: hypothetical protein [unclassified Duganella]|uniref:hypothetical protein n=1 Tax=unclassified Duganella TaxID=2636909 RepID=UPI000873BF36|nr:MULTISPECIES: hypothetical protein [unclassified Duganella]OEZ58820.1 hypothetical protein DUGA6_37570 [Duganella sp. HH105]OEZ97866.1 hypothetical protein DUGA2_58400 [Duganella sp. HH101]
MIVDTRPLETIMINLPPLVTALYKAWLRARLERYTRALEAIAAQRENDFHAERVLHKEVVLLRSKLNSL